MSLVRSLLVTTLLFSTAAVAQAVPERLTFTGRLVRTDGQPESGPHTLRFIVYDQAAGGTNLWEETRTVTLSNGYYTVDLGAVAMTPLSTIFTGPVRYLGISLDAQSEMQPRVALLSAPYALRAGEAAKATSADTATSATTAANATNATNAVNATNATKALSADDAKLLDGFDSTDFALVAHTHPAATTSAAGFMSSADKTKLNAVPSTYGGGLTLSGTNLDVKYAGNGNAFGTSNTVARSDHSHPLPTLQCTQVTATNAFNVGAVATCGASEVVTGGGCTDLPDDTNFNTTAAPTANGFQCKGTGANPPTSNVTATAICCKLQ